MDNVHNRIKALRESCDYTQEYVGMVLGISQQAYSNYEINKRTLARHVICLQFNTLFAKSFYAF